METPKNFFTPHVVKYLIKNAPIMLATLSGYMYICAYSYEQAYLKEFDISSFYLNLDINTILRDATRIIGIVILLTGIYQLLLRILHPLLIKSKLYQETIQTLIIIFVVLILTWLYLPVNKYLFLYIFSILGIIYLCILFISFLRNINKKRTVLKRDSAFSDSKKKTIMDLINIMYISFCS